MTRDILSFGAIFILATVLGCVLSGCQCSCGDRCECVPECCCQRQAD